MDYLKMSLDRVVNLQEAGTAKTLLEHQAEACEAAVGVDDSESRQTEARMDGEQ